MHLELPAGLFFSDTHTSLGHTPRESPSLPSHRLPWCQTFSNLQYTRTHTHTLPCQTHAESSPYLWCHTAISHTHLSLLHPYTQLGVIRTRALSHGDPSFLLLFTHLVRFTHKPQSFPRHTPTFPVAHTPSDVTVAHLHVSHPATASLESHPHPFLVTSPHQLL